MNPGRTIRAQLLVLVMAVVLPLAALIAYNVYLDFIEARKAAAETSVRLVEITTADTTRFLGDSRELLRGLSRQPLVRALDPQRCDPLFSNFSELHTRFALVFTMHLSGTPVCASGTSPARQAGSLVQQYDLREFRRTGKFAIGKPIVGPLTGKWVVVLYQPLQDDTGGLSGAVALSIDLANFHPIADSVELPSATVVRIISSEGTVIATLRDAKTEVGKSRRGGDIVDTVLARKRGETRAVASDGIERIYGFAPIPGTDWYAYAGVPVSIAFAQAYDLALRNAGIGLLLVLLSIALAGIVTRRIVGPIAAMADTAREIERGNAEARFRAQGAAEVADVATQFNRALDALAEDERLLRQLSRRLLETQEDERRRLARELHDRIGQNVTALTLNLNMLRGELPAESTQKVGAHLNDCETLLYSTGQLVRDVMADLRPPGLDELGLLAALTEHARQIAGISGFTVVVSGAEITPRLPPQSEITLFRIAQEALINIAKHARASEVTIALEASPERVAMTISDNGCGFDAAERPSDAAPRLGMTTMRERAEAISGRLRVESAPGARHTRHRGRAPRAPHPMAHTAFWISSGVKRQGEIKRVSGNSRALRIRGLRSSFIVHRSSLIFLRHADHRLRRG